MSKKKSVYASNPKEQVRVPVNPVMRLTTNLARLYKLCLFKQEQFKEGVYYSSHIKLIVSTFLVYKVKKCLVKSGKVTKILPKYVNDIWALVARYMGNGCPVLVQSMPDACSLVARRLFTGSPLFVHW